MTAGLIVVCCVAALTVLLVVALIRDQRIDRDGWRILDVLAEHPYGLTADYITAATGLDAVRRNRALLRLEVGHLIVGQRVPGERRVYRLTRTGWGMSNAQRPPRPYLV